MTTGRWVGVKVVGGSMVGGSVVSDFKKTLSRETFEYALNIRTS